MTSLSPGNGEKMSKRGVAGRDVAGLLARFAELRRKAEARTGQTFPIIVIQEAGLDGFWLHRLLKREGFESHVVDPARSPCRAGDGGPRRTRSTGKLSSRALLAYKRGEPRVCAMVVAPSVEEEDYDYGDTTIFTKYRAQFAWAGDVRRRAPAKRGRKPRPMSRKQ